jgi:hypothetical protein
MNQKKLTTAICIPQPTSISKMTLSHEQVFATPELHEAILLNLPLRHLLVHAQLVSRSWHSLISSSPVLQQSLFFRPSIKEPQEPSRLNPLLCEAFPPWFKNLSLSAAQSYGLFHPKCFEDLDWNSNDNKKVAYAREDASWRRMLVVQPPVRTLQMIRRWSGRNPDTYYECRLQCEEGLSMGLLYDIIQGHFLVPQFGLHWHMVPVEKERESDDEDEAEFGERDISDSEIVPFQPRDQVTVMTHIFVGCIPDMSRCLNRSFKSQGFKQVNIPWVAVIR